MLSKSVFWMLAEYTVSLPPSNQAQQMGDGLLAGVIIGLTLFGVVIIGILAYSLFSNFRDWVSKKIWSFKYRAKK